MELYSANMITILDFLFWIVYMLNVPRVLHIMQLESYQNDGMFRWIVKNPKLAFKKGAMQFLITGAVYLLTGLLALVLQDLFTSAWGMYLFRM